jgi:hypothetical protein
MSWLSSHCRLPEDAVLLSAPEGDVCMVDPVETLLREYTAKLRAVIGSQLEEDVTAAVRKAFGGPAVSAGASSSKSTTTALQAPRVGKGTSAAPGPAKGSKAASGGRRSPATMARQTGKILAYIKAHPGQRSEQISEATKISTGVLALPLKKLVADKKIKSSGVARGTTYTAVKE